jgi:hypothetical protein
MFNIQEVIFPKRIPTYEILNSCMCLLLGILYFVNSVHPPNDRLFPFHSLSLSVYKDILYILWDVVSQFLTVIFS